MATRRIRFTINTYRIDDKEAWREWRKKTIGSLQCATASTIGAYFGHHYSSFKQTLAETFTPKEPDAFAKRAMAHGETNEDYAKREYLTIIGNKHKILCNGEESRITAFVHKNANISDACLMTTPDMIIKLGRSKEIVEFKCPYFEIFLPKTRNNRTIPQIAWDFLERFPNGKEASFIQGSVYALCEGDVNIVNVVYFFTDTTENIAMVIYTYDISRVMFMEDYIIDAAVKINLELKKDSSAYRTKTQDKIKISAALRNSCIDSKVYYRNEEHEWVLYEQPKDESKSQRPDEPREESTGSF